MEMGFRECMEMVFPPFSASYTRWLCLGEHDKMFRKHTGKQLSSEGLFADKSRMFLLFWVKNRERQQQGGKIKG